jgi:hypothetical protein
LLRRHNRRQTSATSRYKYPIGVFKSTQKRVAEENADH